MSPAGASSGRANRSSTRRGNLGSTAFGTCSLGSLRRTRARSPPSKRCCPPSSASNSQSSANRIAGAPASRCAAVSPPSRARAR